jgi:hypothetical protein
MPVPEQEEVPLIRLLGQKLLEVLACPLGGEHLGA